MFKSIQALSNISFSWSPTLWKFESCLDIQIERWSNWDTEPELPCEVLMRIHLLHSSFTSNICESSRSSQGYLAVLSQQYSQQSCFVTTPGQISVSFGRSKRYRETKSSIIPLTLCFWPQGWRCYWRFHEIWSLEAEPVQISVKRDTPTRQIPL